MRNNTKKFLFPIIAAMFAIGFLAVMPAAASAQSVTIPRYQNQTLTAPVSVPIGTTLTIRSASAANPVTLTRGVCGGNLFVVPNGAKLVLENIIIDGNNDTCTDNGSSLVYIGFGGELVMNAGAVLRNNNGDSGGGVSVIGGTFTMTGGEISGNTANSGGGVLVIGGGTFTMTGGEISGNAANFGGGVYVLGGTFTMTGGEISGNTANSYFGGGVYVIGNSTFTMTGGEISGNTANTNGGGVYAGGNGTLTLGGRAVISGNTAYTNGGGVYVDSNGTFTMTGGEISGNTANTNGGGVYVGGNGTLTLGGRAVISGNTAYTNDDNVFLSYGAYITPGTGAAAPAYDMNIRVTKSDDNGVIVKSGASAAMAAHFHADESGKGIILMNGRLVVTSGYGPFWDFLQQVILFEEANSDRTITVDHDLTLAVRVTIPVPQKPGAVLTIKGSTPDVTLTRGINGSLFTVGGGATLILEDIIIDGGDPGAFKYNLYGPLVSADGGELVMKDGVVLRNNRTMSCGGVRVLGGGTFTMNGGEISGNIAGQAGGVCVGGNGTFTMTGGKITGNAVYGYEASPGLFTEGIGGGVLILSDFVFSGTATGGTFIMTGGEITGNTAVNGGGVHIEIGKFTMNGGEISGNIAGHGGGVYFSDSYYNYNMPGVTVTDNEFTIGGAAVIRGNLNDNVYIEDGQYILLDTDAATAAPEMAVGVTKPGDGGVIVQSARPGDETYFFADESGKKIVYDAGQLRIVDLYIGISITSMPEKTVYAEGETLDLTGLVITAAYSDGSSKAVSGYTTNPAAGTVLGTIGTQTVSVSYTEDGIVKTTDFNVTVNPKPEPVDPPIFKIRYQLVGTTRIGLANYDYTFKAFVTNTGGGAADVIAKLAGKPATVTIGDVRINFGDVAAGATEEGDRTFTVRVDRTGVFDESLLVFEFTYSDPE